MLPPPTPGGSVAVYQGGSQRWIDAPPPTQAGPDSGTQGLLNFTPQNREGEAASGSAGSGNAQGETGASANEGSGLSHSQQDGLYLTWDTLVFTLLGVLLLVGVIAFAAYKWGRKTAMIKGELLKRTKSTVI